MNINQSYINSYCKIKRKWYNISVDASWERRYIMSFNGKHLSLEDRNKIEENIRKGLRKFETAKELNKSQSTIGKEDIHKLMIHHGCVNIFMNAKFVLVSVKVSKKFHALEEIVSLVHAIAVQKSNIVKKQSIFIMQM